MTKPNQPMNLTEFIIENTAFVMASAAFTPTLCLRPSPLRSGSHGERESCGEVVLVGRLREAIRRLKPAIPSRTLATLRDTLLSGELAATILNERGGRR